MGASKSPLATVIESILTEPTPEALGKLQPLLLAIDHPEAEAAHEIAGEFFRYLSSIRNMLTARQFPIIATSLAVTSTGISMAEDIFSESETNMLKLMTDGLKVALDTLTTYQFVRQWEPSFAAVHDQASWKLYQYFWQLSADHQPELDANERATHLETLFSIVRDPETESALRLAFLVRLFQWGLITRLVSILQSTAQKA